MLDRALRFSRSTDKLLSIGHLKKFDVDKSILTAGSIKKNVTLNYNYEKIKKIIKWHQRTRLI